MGNGQVILPLNEEIELEESDPLNLSPLSKNRFYPNTNDIAWFVINTDFLS